MERRILQYFYAAAGERNIPAAGKYLRGLWAGGTEEAK